MIDSLGARSVQVREEKDLAGLDGLILPGGESTAIHILSGRGALLESLRQFVKDHSKAIWGTCAGLILLSDHLVLKEDYVVSPEKPLAQSKSRGLIGGLNVVTCRNFFGRQNNSFVADLKAPSLFQKTQAETNLNGSAVRQVETSIHSTSTEKAEEGEGEGVFQAVFIRAPVIVSVEGEDVQILNTVDVKYADLNEYTTSSAKKLPNELICAVRQHNILATAFHPELTPSPQWHQFYLDWAASLRVDLS